MNNKLLKFLMVIAAAAQVSICAAPTSGPAPATAPAEETYPGDALIAACGDRAQQVQSMLGESFSVKVAPPFVVAGDMGGEDTAAHMQRSVVRPAGAMWRSYFRRRPDRPVTILLFSSDQVYGEHAKRLFGDDNVAHFGYYKSSRQTLLISISTGTGTLVHELTHALIAYDFPAVPLWFNEGLASLHEQCNVGEDRIVGLVNWRLPILQAAIDKGVLRPLRETISRDDFYGPLLGLNYAQARYFCMYMQHLGLLDDFYAYYRDHHEGPDAAVSAVEHVLGKPIDEVEKLFLEYVKTLKFGRD